MKKSENITASKPAFSTATSRCANNDTPPNDVSPEERNGMIATAAYYRAEWRGFAEGSELEDWLAAEAEVNQHLKR